MVLGIVIFVSGEEIYDGTGAPDDRLQVRPDLRTVAKLLEGEVGDSFRISDYSLEHGSMAEKLTKLKDIFICHYHVREKEILQCVAKDMANKEIADHLCLSINTATTYRRNIQSKLQIHSAAGPAIFAILHQVVDIQEVYRSYGRYPLPRGPLAAAEQSHDRHRRQRESRTDKSRIAAIEAAVYG